MLTLFGNIAVGSMFLFYWMERRSKWFVLLFAIGCAASASYGFLIRSYPFGVIESAWALVALQRFSQARGYSASNRAQEPLAQK